MFRAALLIPIGLVLAPALAVAQVQPGSTGGAIGKMEKSVSGGEDAPAVRAPKSTHRARPDAPAKPAESPRSKTAACSRAIGTWFWVTEVVTIKPGGSISAKGGPGNWTCADGLLHVFWPGFVVPHEIFSISEDGNRLISQNTSSAPRRIR